MMPCLFFLGGSVTYWVPISEKKVSVQVKKGGIKSNRNKREGGKKKKKP
jgi:hypothetical protein